MRGHQFMRQKPIDEYIVDFYCSKLKLVIEIDGESHDGKFEKDMIRQQKLESLGLTVLRFNDLDVKRDMGNVLMAIEGWIKENNLLTHNGDNPLTHNGDNPLTHNGDNPLPHNGDNPLPHNGDNPLTPFSKGE
jgi:hypothetical protein